MKALGFILGFAVTGAAEYAFVMAMGERFGLGGLQIQGLGFLILPVGVGLAAADLIPRLIGAVGRRRSRSLPRTRT